LLAAAPGSTSRLSVPTAHSELSYIPGSRTQVALKQQGTIKGGCQITAQSLVDGPIMWARLENRKSQPAVTEINGSITT
jgi:hypothetical protein